MPDLDDRLEVICCAGPPACPFEGDDAVAAMKAGCPLCRHILIEADGSETVYQRKAN